MYLSEQANIVFLLGSHVLVEALQTARNANATVLPPNAADVRTGPSRPTRVPPSNASIHGHLNIGLPM